MKRRNAGFTLVELLIVIAIIGVLAAVILSRLQGARDESLIVKTKAEMNLISKRAAVEENKSLTYDVVCGSNGVSQASSLSDQITAVETFTGESITCNSRTAGYALSITLSSSTYWCVDSAGRRQERTTDLLATEFACQ